MPWWVLVSLCLLYSPSVNAKDKNSPKNIPLRTLGVVDGEPPEEGKDYDPKTTSDRAEFEVAFDLGGCPKAVEKTKPHNCLENGAPKKPCAALKKAQAGSILVFKRAAHPYLITFDPFHDPWEVKPGDKKDLELPLKDGAPIAFYKFTVSAPAGTPCKKAVDPNVIVTN
jgi:hypothetical protein